MYPTEDDEQPDEPDSLALNEEALFWFGEYCARGMCSPQAAVLASRDGLDRHAVREWLDQGCDPDVAFLIAS